MNKIFKVIWSKSKQCYIVVSEMAKNKTGKKKIIVAGIFATLALTSNVVTVHGAMPDGSRTDMLGVAIGTGSASNSNQSVAIGYASSAQAPTSNPENPATAVGPGANANGAGAVALGLSSNATGTNAIALGGGSNGGTNKTEATAKYATAIGFNAKASQENAVALGSSATAAALNSIAMGKSASITAPTTSTLGGQDSIAMGTRSAAKQHSSVSIGLEASSDGVRSVAIGPKASAKDEDSIAIGTGGFGADKNNQAAGDNGGSVTQALNGISGVQLYYGAKSTGKQSIAIGYIANAKESGIAFGNYAVSDGGGGTAMGKSVISRNGGIVVGQSSNAIGQNSVAYGNIVNATDVNSVALGNRSTASNQNAVAVGYNNNATGKESVAIGNGNQGSNEGAVSIGASNSVTANNAVAIGRGSNASGLLSTAIGNGATSKGVYDVAIGSDVTANGNNSVAIGRNAKTSNASSLAIGVFGSKGTSATGDYSIAMGRDVTASAESAVAIGKDAVADKKNAVAFGSGSTTSSSATAQSSTTIGGKTYSWSKGVLSGADLSGMQVSVGKTGFERQIKNVAAGEISANSTDAINGAQLYSVASGLVKDLKVPYVSIKSGATGAGSNVNNDGATGANSIAIGPSSAVTNQNGIAFGNNAQSLSDDSIVIGRNAKAESGSGFTTTSRAIAIGANSKVATNVTQGIAIGSGSLADEGAVVTGDQSIAIGGNVKVDGHAAIAIGGDDARKAGSMPVTYTNTNNAEVTGTLQSAISNLTGYNLSKYQGTTAGHAGVAYGTSALAGNAGVAIGTASDSMTRKDDKGQVVDNKPVTNAVAIGTGARANFDNSVAIGGGSNTDHYATKQVNAIIDGVEVKWAGGDNIAPGDVVSFGAKGFERQLKNVAPGEVSQTSTDAVNGSQIYSLARKVTNIMNGGAGSVVNVNASGEPLSKVVTGTGTSKVAKYYRTVDVKDDGSLKPGAVAQTPTSLSLVNIDQTDVNQQTQVPRTLGNVANGVKDNDAVNVSQLNAAKVKYFSVNSTDAGNKNNDGATGTDAIAIGPSATANAKNAIALGKGASTAGQGSLAFGVSSQANGESALAMGFGAQANSNYAVSLGYQANNSATNNANGVSIGWAAGMQSNGASNVGIGTGAGRQIVGNNNVSIGNGAGNIATNSMYTSDSIMLGTQARAINGTASKAVSSVIAIGKGALGGADSAIALGQGASSTNQNAIAIGTNSQATAYNGVAIGSYSVANTVGGINGFNPNTSRTDTYSGLAGRALTSTTGAVAIGSDSQSRQLTGLAAGTADTDAVNVAQLKSVNLAFKGNTGTGDVNLAAHPLTIQGNDDYITTSATGNTINVSGKVQNITVTNGTATAANKGMADAQNVANAINNAIQSNAYKWRLTANGEATPEIISKDDTVDFSGDTNISVARNGKKITTSLKKDITVDTVKANKSVTIGTGSNQITLDGNSGAVTGRTFSGNSFVAGNNVLSNTTLQIGSPTGANNVSITTDGLTAKAGAKTVKFGTNGIDAGGQQITNVSSGGNVGTNAANITDVQNAVSSVSLSLDTNSKTGSVNLKSDTLKITGANGIRTDLIGTGNRNLVIGLDQATVNATTKGIGLTGDTGSTGLKYLKDGDATFKVYGDGNLVTTKASAIGVQVAVDTAKVKDLAVNAVTVSKANTADNPITVTPTAGTNSKDYAIGIDTTKLAAKTNLAYTANGATAKTVSLSKGLNFVDGTNTVSSVDSDGKVSFDLNKATQTSITNSATAVGRTITLNADSGTGSSQSLSTGNVSFAVSGATGDYISTQMDGSAVKVSTKRATINSNASTGEASVTGNDGLTTAKNVADAINNTNTVLGNKITKNAQDIATNTTNIAHTIALADDKGASTTAKSLKDGNVSFNIKGDNKFISTAASGNDVTLTVNEQAIKDTAKAASSFKVKANTHAEEEVKGGDTIAFNNGDNIEITQTGKTFTIGTAKNITVDSVTAGNTVINTNGLTNGTTAITGTGITTDKVTVGGLSIDKTNGINAGGKVITNVASGGTTDTNAANIGDVKQAVANLSQNLNITDGINNGTVDLKNQKLNVAGANGVTATVNNQTITVGLDANTVNATTKGIGLTGDTGSTGNKYLKDGDVSFAVTGDGSLVSTTATAAGVKVAVNAASITAGTDGTITGPTTDGVATAKNVADAINAAKKASKTEITANTGEAANATKGNVTLTSTTAADGHTIYDVKLNDKVTLGSGANAVTIDGTAGKATIGSSIIDGVNNTFTTGGTSPVTLNGATGTITGTTANIGGVTVNGTVNDITGLSNTTVTGADFATKGRAATEEQLKAATGATTLKFVGDVATNTGSVNLKDDTFGIKGDGKYISTDVNGKNVNLTVSEAEVKKSAVAAVTVSTDTTDANNPLTVTPTTSADGTTKDYKVTIDGTKIANKTNLSYKANNGTAKQVSLADGLDFTNGTLTTASIDNKGVVKYDVNTATITAGADGTITGPTTDGVATAKNVADAINAAKKASKTEITANTGEAANATKGNVTLTSTTAADGHTIYDVKLNDKVTLGSGANAVTIDGTAGKATIGSSIIDGVNNTFTTGGTSPVTLNGATGTITGTTANIGGVTVNGTVNDITGLSNTTVTGADFATKGRAATEEQLKAVGEQTWKITADKDATTSGAQTGTKKDAKVGKDDKVQLIAGENLTVNQNERDFTYSLNKDLVKMNSATFEATGGKTTVIKGDSIVQTDGTKVNTSNATSNTITDGTNTSTITAGKATIGTVGIDGIASKITTGGANAVVINGADGTVKTGTITVTGGTTNDITGLSNTTVTAADFATKGRAATEEQLKAATGATTLKFTGDVATNTGSVNLKDDIFGIKGDGKYISTDVNGKNVNLTVSEAEVKKSAVAAVTVSTDTTDANNPLTVTPTTSADGTTKDYKVTIDGTKIANKTNLSYKANNGTAKQVSLADGLDFTNGTLTTASIDNKGVVKYDVNTATITAGADGTITGPTTDGVATAKNVADAINAAKKASKTEITANTGEAANATKGNVTLTSTTAADGHTIYDVKLNDKVTLGSGANAVTIDGTAGKATIGSSIIDGVNNTFTTGGTSPVTLNGATGTIIGTTANIGGVTVNGTNNHITGLANTTWNGTATTGRAATEDQLKVVADAAGSQTWEITADKKSGTSGAQTGTKENAKVGKDDKVSLIAGENLTVEQAGKNFTYSLNKDLVKMNSATFEATGGKTTVIKGDSIVQTDGTKVNISNATSNTITDGTNTSAITAGKATIGSSVVDGVNNTFTTGGANAVKLDGTAGTIKTGTVTVTGGTTNDITGLSNTTVTGADFATKGRAATEEQLKAATGATTLKFTGDVATNTGSVNLKDDIFGIKGDGKYISTDVNGKNVNLTVSEAEVKKSAVAAVTVSTDTTDANNPLTVTPTTSADGTTKDYKVTIDGTKIANKTNLSYKANNGTAKQVSLADGLDFTNGTLTTASIDNKGVVKYDVNTATITAGADGTITGPTTDGVATAKNVADAINAAKKASKTEITANTGEAANATKGNVTLTSTTAADGHTIYDVKLNDKVTLGSGANAVTIDGTAGKATIGSSIIDGVNNTFTTGGTSPVTLNGATGTITGTTANIGGVTVNGTVNDITGLSNTTVTGADFATKGRAATEEQLKAVGEQTWQITADKDAATSGAQTGTKKNAKVGKDDKVQLIAGENLTVNQNERDFTFTLNKDLVKMNSATFLGTGTNITVITGDSITQTAGTQTNTSTAGGNTVADGTKSTETTAAGQVIKDGAKSNKSTVDSNVIDDGNGNVNTSNATSNTITDGTNTSTITAGKATIGSSIVDGVNNTFTTGGASPVTLNGATGTITGKTANIGGVTVNGTTNDITGLSNTTVTGADFATKGRAATEEQLKAVGEQTWQITADKDAATSGAQTGTKKDAKVGKDDKVQLIAGENLTVNQNERDFTYSLNKDLVKMNSATFEATGGKTTVVKGDSIVQTDGTKTNTATAGGNTVADGTKSTKTTADGQVIKDGAKTNTSTVDENTIVDGTKSNKSTVDGNTITDGTNTTATTSSSVTVKDNAGNSTVITKDNITTGVGANKVILDGTAGKATIGSSVVDGVNNTFTTGGANAVKLDGAAGTIKTGTVTVTGGTTNDITGLSNTTVTAADFATKGRAATEEQLKAVGEQTWQITADKDAATSGAQTGTKKNAKVGKDDKVQLIAGENMTVNQNERDFTFTLNKDLVKMNSATFEATGGKTTVIKGDSIVQTDGTKTNTATAGGNTVADGTKSTEITAAGQVIKDGAKSNKSTVDSNVIDDGDGNVNTSNATSNTITDGTNTSTITAGKATIGSSIIDGVNNTFTTGGANTVKLDGAAGTIKTGTVTVTGGTTNDITGLSNTTVTAADFATKGRAATEEQLKAVGEQTWQITADKDAATSGAQTGTKKDAKVGKDDKVQLIAGENLTVNQNERDFTYSLNKDLVKMNSATFLGTGMNTTVITGDSITQTAGTQTNTSTAGGNTVADGTKSTETTAAGQVIKDGGKTNKSTVDNNVIDDGNSNVNTSNATSNIITDGTNTSTITAGKATIGSSIVDGVNNTFTTGGANTVKLDGAAGTIKTGTVTVTGGTTNDITGLSNTTVTGADFATKGRAATEEQLKAVGEQTWQITADKDAATSGAQTGTKKNAKVGKDDKVQLIAGENMTVNQNERDFTFTLNKDLVKMNSATFLGTGTNTTVITGDSITQTAGTQTNTSTAGGNTVADGTKSTKTTADGQVIKDGAKSNKSTVDSNVINDGNGNVNTSNATSNTITDGTNTSAITAGKATIGSSIVDGVNNTFTTGGANTVKLDGAAGTIKTGTVTVTGGTTNDITGLSNTTVTAADFATKGRAATEEQLKAVGEQTWQITADKDAATSGAQTGTKKNAKVGKDDKVQLIAGENMTVNQNERDFTFTLNKDLVKMNSATFEATGGKTTVIKGDSIVQTDGTKTNTATAGGNTVADGTKSTETTAAGQVIKDGAKSNKSTVDSNVINDGNGNVNTSNATSNTITDGTNTSMITAGKANIGNVAVDGVNNKITMGNGANSVTLDGANGHLDGLTNTTWVPGVTKATTGRAATEDQLQQVSDAVGAGWKVNTGAVTGSSGVSNGATSTKVSSGEEVKLQAGDNLVIDQNGKTVSYSLNKDLTKMNSATFEATGGKTTVIKGDSIVQTDGGKTNTSTAAGNTVVDGNKSTATTAAGTTITDGTKTNTSTADKNVIDDGAGNKSTFTKDGITITKTGKDTVSLTGNGLDNGNNKIVNVADGTAAKDAVNVSQLDAKTKAATTELTANGGQSAGNTTGNIVLTKTTAADGHTIYDNKLNDKITLGAADPTKAITVDGTAGTIKAGKDGNAVAINGTNGTVKAGDGTNAVAIDGVNGSVAVADKITLNGKDGKAGIGTVGIDGKDGIITTGGTNSVKVDGSTGTVTGLTNKTWTPGSIVSGRAATEDQLKSAVADSGWKATIGTDGSGQSHVVGTSPEKIKAEETVTFKAGNNMVVTQDGKSISYAVNPELTDMKSATFKDAAGNTTVTNGNGMTITPGSANPTNPNAEPVSLTKDGLNNGNNQIKGVAPGTDPTDAVNVGQLNASNASTSQAINQVAAEVQRVGAHAAAMAALKPIQYDPLEPTQVMAGVGNYRGETAAALGLAHYTNENTMFNVGVSVGGNHNMVNAGVTHKFGYSPEKKNIPDRYKAGPISSVYVMQDEVSSLKKENAEQKYVIADQAARLTTLEAENEQQRRELAETKKGLDDLKAAVDKLLASKG